LGFLGTTKYWEHAYFSFMYGNEEDGLHSGHEGNKIEWSLFVDARDQTCLVVAAPMRNAS